MKQLDSNDNLSIRKYINKTEHQLALKIKIWYYVEHLTPEMITLIWSTISKKTRDKNGEKMPFLKLLK